MCPSVESLGSEWLCQRVKGIKKTSNFLQSDDLPRLLNFFGKTCGFREKLLNLRKKGQVKKVQIKKWQVSDSL